MVSRWRTRTHGTSRQVGKRFRPSSGSLRGAKHSQTYRPREMTFDELIEQRREALETLGRPKIQPKDVSAPAVSTYDRGWTKFKRSDYNTWRELSTSLGEVDGRRASIETKADIKVEWDLYKTTVVVDYSTYYLESWYSQESDRYWNDVKIAENARVRKVFYYYDSTDAKEVRAFVNKAKAYSEQYVQKAKTKYHTAEGKQQVMRAHQAGNGFIDLDAQFEKDLGIEH